VSGGTLWLLLVGGSVLLTLLPWLPPLRKAPAARSTSTLQRLLALLRRLPVRRHYHGEAHGRARVRAGSTGRSRHVHELRICVGACPTATPFRRASDLSAGIELPDRSVAGLRDEVVAAAARLTGEAKVIVFVAATTRIPWRLRIPRPPSSPCLAPGCCRHRSSISCCRGATRTEC